MFIVIPSWIIPVLLVLAAFLFLGLREAGDRVTNVLYTILFTVVVVLVYSNIAIISKG